MKIQIASDLHTEFPQNRRALRDLPVAAPVLVLAGDIGMLCDDRMRDTFDDACSRWKTVVYVPGNHEFYRSSPKFGGEILADVCREHLNFVHLDGAAIANVGGVRFLGGTMWFPRTPDAERYKSFLNDFKMVSGLVPWCYEENARLRKFLTDYLREGDVVVTHHIPSHEAVAPQYKNDPTNCFFVSPMDDLIAERKPALWVHGHSHTAMDVQVGSTRIVSNPHGYPLERYKPYEPVVVEV